MFVIAMAIGHWNYAIGQAY